MITSRENDKLKLVRRLAERRHRAREGLFVTEGEDLLDAGRAAGLEPELLLTTPGTAIGGLEVERELLASVATLGSGTRAIAVWPLRFVERPSGPVCAYLHGVGDPANVGAVIRSAAALVEGSVALGPGCADPHAPKAVRASMGAIFAIPFCRCEVEATPEPRVALVAHGGSARGPGAPPVTLCLGAEREGLPERVVGLCQRSWTIPLRPGAAESLNVAAAAAIALERISSAAAGLRGEGQ